MWVAQNENLQPWHLGFCLEAPSGDKGLKSRWLWSGTTHDGWTVRVEVGVWEGLIEQLSYVILVVLVSQVLMWLFCSELGNPCYCIHTVCTVVKVSHYVVVSRHLAEVLTCSSRKRWLNPQLQLITMIPTMLIVWIQLIDRFSMYRFSLLLII